MFVYIAYNLVMLLFFFIPLPFMVNKRFSYVANEPDAQRVQCRDSRGHLPWELVAGR